jgi:hypothetical protein
MALRLGAMHAPEDRLHRPVQIVSECFGRPRPRHAARLGAQSPLLRNLPRFGRSGAQRLPIHGDMPLLMRLNLCEQAGAKRNLAGDQYAVFGLGKGHRDGKWNHAAPFGIGALSDSDLTPPGGAEAGQAEMPRGGDVMGTHQAMQIGNTQSGAERGLRVDDPNIDTHRGAWASGGRETFGCCKGRGYKRQGKGSTRHSQPFRLK